MKGNKKMSKTFKIFCGDCKVEYEQKSEKNPYCCGCCGSTWIAVKDVNVNSKWFSYGKDHLKDSPAEEISCDCLERIEEIETPKYRNIGPEEIDEL